MTIDNKYELLDACYGGSESIALKLLEKKDIYYMYTCIGIGGNTVLFCACNNEMEKVRTIFTWAAHKIRYDDHSYNANTIKAMSAEEVISKKRAVCDGYSTLFQALCEEAGFECRKIYGYSKGYGYSPGDQMTEADHAWNAIHVEEKWYLMDVTWASGYGVTKNGKLTSVSEFDDYWFDVNPKEFIFTHMPEESKWQFIPHSYPFPSSLNYHM